MIQQIDKSNFDVILDFITSSTGIILPDTNYSLLDAFLRERLAALNISFDEYLKIIRRKSDERIYFIDTITINETYFFREEKHFDILFSYVFFKLKNNDNFPIKIWSASCSTGEEPISLYLLAEKFFGSNELFSVYASDINQSVIKVFEKGLYKKNSFREDGKKYHYLINTNNIEDKYLKIKDKIIESINKGCINISNLKNVKNNAKYDLVFFRNTLIYFDIEKRSNIINAIVDKMNDNCFLFLSSSEVPFISHPNLELEEKYGSYFFKKISKSLKDDFHFISRPILEEINKHEKNDEIKKNVIKQYNIDIILDFANQKLNNKLFDIPKNQNYEMALKIIKIIYLINTNDYTKADRLISLFKDLSGENELYFYFMGILKIMNKDEKEAIHYLDRLLMENPVFWPARFHRAKLYFNLSRYKKSYKDFIKCSEDIEKYINTKSYHYQILLEGFNGKYFLNISQKWIHKLQDMEL